MASSATARNILSFTDIEGDTAPEYCFLSRQIVTHANPVADDFLDAFVTRTSEVPAFASALYSAGLRH